MSKSECRKSRALISSCLLNFALLTGCDDATTANREPKLPVAKALDAGPPANSDATTADGATERNFDGAIFQVPAAWKEVPRKNDMINAEFAVPGTAGDARLTLSTAGGDVQANIDRWKGQFSRGPDDPSPKESTLQVGGKEAQLVELSGGYQDTIPGAVRKSGQAMFGVVIPLRIAGRETNYFVKLTGPRETLSDARDTFLKFVETAKFKD